MNKFWTYIILLISFGCAFSTSQDKVYDLIINDVNIFNSITLQVDSNKAICIVGDTIVKITDSNHNFKSRESINGHGKLLLPGFIDTHVHLNSLFGPGADISPKDISDINLYKQELKEQYLKYGVTTILDLGQPEGWLPISSKWQKAPSTEYPNVYNSGSALKSDYDWPPAPHHAEIYDKHHAQEKLSYYDSIGVRHIKLYSWLRRADIISVLEVAKEKSLIPFGHIDRGEVEISEGIDLGIRNFEHFFTIINGVINVEEHWIALNKRYNLATQTTIDEWTAKMILYFDYVDSSPELSQKVDALLDKIAASESTISTTIHPLASVAEEANFFSTFEIVPRRDKPYMPSYKNLNKEELKNGIRAMKKFLKAAHDKGIKLRIGTDCRFGGKAMINEFLFLHEAGISTASILKIATFNAAEAMGINDHYGSIEEGKIADLILFDKSPLADIRNFESNRVVIKKGKVVSFQEPITQDFVQEILKRGINEGIGWYNRSKNNLSYYSDKRAHVMEVGYELLKLRKINEAISLFKFCQKEFPKYNESYNWINEEQLDNEAFVLNNQGDIQGAIELLKFIANLFPESHYAYNSLGEIYYQNGQLKEAKTNFEKALRINPEDERSKTMMKKLEE